MVPGNGHASLFRLHHHHVLRPHQRVGVLLGGHHARVGPRRVVEEVVCNQGLLMLLLLLVVMVLLLLLGTHTCPPHHVPRRTHRAHPPARSHIPGAHLRNTRTLVHPHVGQVRRWQLLLRHHVLQVG